MLTPIPYLETARPEDVGISHTAILSFIDQLEKACIPMHSLLIVSKDKLVAEGYYAPYTRDTLHRMFSVSKSLTSMAIGLMNDQGLLNLDDPIAYYFPEYITPSTHPYITSMTIRHMLKMETCHSSTTYKRDLSANWVASFFQTPPTHPSGMSFNYDTSSSHTLCALVEKLSGQTLLDYLRQNGFEELGFSSEAYMLNDPFGVSMGGTGLMAKPMDLLLMGLLLHHQGYNLQQHPVLPADYMAEATSKQTDTLINGPVMEEQQGYGYQLWRTTHNGVACYGMGGQFAISYPDKDLLLVTTADTQGIQGANQTIYRLFYDTVYQSSRSDAYPQASATDYEAYDQTLNHLCISSVQVSNGTDLYPNASSPISSQVHQTVYHLDPNPQGFNSVSLSFNSKKDEAQLIFVINQQSHTLSFGMGHLVTDTFPLYRTRCASSGAWLQDNRLYIKSHLIDECIGSVQFHLTFKENRLALYMKKIEETAYQEFSGYLTGQY